MSINSPGSKDANVEGIKVDINVGAGLLVGLEEGCLEVVGVGVGSLVGFADGEWDFVGEGDGRM